MADEYKLPLPRPTAVTKPYWDAAKQHELSIQRCRAGDHMFFFPRESCPVCLSDNLEWVTVSGKARLYSYTIVHRPANPAFADLVPYNLSIVQLDEGPRLISTVVDCELDDLEIDMPLDVHFDDVTDDVTLVKFRPATG